LVGIDPNTISAYGAAASAAVAAIALWYNAIQTKAAKRVFDYQILKDFSDQIDKLESSEATTPKDEYRLYHIKYLNIFDRLVYLLKKKVIQEEDLLKYFLESFKIAKGILEMKEYANLKKEGYSDLNNWCDKHVKDAASPLLPNPDIHIENGLFSPKEYDAKVGSFVTWISDDTLVHRIMSLANGNETEGIEFDSGDSGVLALTGKGKKFSHRFNAVNSYEYFCQKHPDKEIGNIKITN
jgi:plastocyanin